MLTSLPPELIHLILFKTHLDVNDVRAVASTCTAMAAIIVHDPYGADHHMSLLGVTPCLRRWKWRAARFALIHSPPTASPPLPATELYCAIVNSLPKLYAPPASPPPEWTTLVNTCASLLPPSLPPETKEAIQLATAGSNVPLELAKDLLAPAPASLLPPLAAAAAEYGRADVFSMIMSMPGAEEVDVWSNVRPSQVTSSAIVELFVSLPSPPLQMMKRFGNGAAERYPEFAAVLGQSGSDEALRMAGWWLVACMKQVQWSKPAKYSLQNLLSFPPITQYLPYWVVHFLDPQQDQDQDQDPFAVETEGGACSLSEWVALAVELGNLDVVSFAFNSPDISHSLHIGRVQTSLFYATSRGNLDMVNAFLQWSRFSPTSDTVQTALRAAAKNHQKHVVDAIVARVLATGPPGRSAILAAVDRAQHLGHVSAANLIQTVLDSHQS